MKQTIFTTRQRAEEIIKEAVTIWEHSNNGEQLEGLDRDPVLAFVHDGSCLSSERDR